MSKTLLKQAKEYIQNQEYTQAIETCQSILESEPSNYHALVFLGVSHQKQSQDPTPFLEKAIQISPKLPLAYQGLIQYYESTSNFNSLAAVLKQFLLIQFEL